MKLFAYAVLYHPDNGERDSGVLDSVLIEPTWVLAKDEEAVRKIAARAIPAEWDSIRINKTEILVRPF